jgi:hypothetical protein
MTKRLIVVLSLLWIVSLIGIAAVAAQVATQPVPPKVLSGSDVGFRVESIDHKSGAVIGHVVVNVNGKWVDAQIGGGLSPKLTP